MTEPAKILKQCYFKLNYVRTQLISPKMAYYCCVSFSSKKVL